MAREGSREVHGSRGVMWPLQEISTDLYILYLPYFSTLHDVSIGWICQLISIADRAIGFHGL